MSGTTVLVSERLSFGEERNVGMAAMAYTFPDQEIIGPSVTVFVAVC
jgi:hypothetical protein